MAYLDDDFQGYSIGTNLPFGSWTGSGFLAQIVSEANGTGIPGTDRTLSLFLASANYDRTTASCLASFSEFFATKLGASTSSQQLVSFINGPNGSGHSFTLLQIRIEIDGTVTALDPTSGEILGNSCDKLYRFYTYNFFQVNVTFSDVTIAGVLRVHIKCDIVMNGETVISFDSDTATGALQLANSTSEVNIFQLNSGAFGAFTLDVLTAINTYPHAGTPNLRAYQAPVEVDELLDSGVLDAIQAVTEVDVLPDSAVLVALQMVVEVDILETTRWYISES